MVPSPVQPLFTASQSGLPIFPINKLTSAQIGFKAVAGLSGADTTVDERGFLRPSDTTKSGPTYDIGTYAFDPNTEAEGSAGRLLAFPDDGEQRRLAVHADRKRVVLERAGAGAVDEGRAERNGQ